MNYEAALKVLEQARDYALEHGSITGTLYGQDGEVCGLGALNKAFSQTETKEHLKALEVGRKRVADGGYGGNRLTNFMDQLCQELCGHNIPSYNDHQSTSPNTAADTLTKVIAAVKKKIGDDGPVQSKTPSHVKDKEWTLGDIFEAQGATTAQSDVSTLADEMLQQLANPTEFELCEAPRELPAEEHVADDGSR